MKESPQFPLLPFSVPNLVEYVMTPLMSGLSDHSPYVRKAAVMGCVKIFYLDKRAVRGMWWSGG